MEFLLSLIGSIFLVLTIKYGVDIIYNIIFGDYNRLLDVITDTLKDVIYRPDNQSEDNRYLCDTDIDDKKYKLGIINIREWKHYMMYYEATDMLLYRHIVIKFGVIKDTGLIEECEICIIVSMKPIIGLSVFISGNINLDLLNKYLDIFELKDISNNIDVLLDFNTRTFKKSSEKNKYNTYLEERENAKNYCMNILKEASVEKEHQEE